MRNKTVVQLYLTIHFLEVAEILRFAFYAEHFYFGDNQ